MDDRLHLVADDADTPSMLALMAFVLIWGVVVCSAIVQVTSLARWN
jgi:hypothetical protein